MADSLAWDRSGTSNHLKSTRTISNHFKPFQTTSAAPLAVFRMLFGLMMLVSIIRFATMGWIHELYIEPTFFFSYWGFEWVKPLGLAGMYGLFGIMATAAALVALGCYYRIAIVVFFLSFTYVELIDKTNYLNHYYFVSLVSLLMVFLPAHRSFSLDIIRKPQLRLKTVPAWTIHVLKLQLAIVYMYAGIAKLNSDWLLNAMPLKIWLPAQSHLPVIGPILEWEMTAYLFSWAGAFYDLFIVCFLLYRPTRIRAYAAVIVFHLSTALLFQIGMFPYIMILSTLIFFSEEMHERIIAQLRAIGRQLKRVVPASKFHTSPDGHPAFFIPNSGKLVADERQVELIGFPDELLVKPTRSRAYHDTKSTILHPKKILHFVHKRAIPAFLLLFFAFQLLFPFRYLLYDGNLLWTEEGYRFSWRVMLMEKAGFANFHVYDPASGKSEQVANYEYLTPVQEKMMSTQPDMILQFAHYLEDVYRDKGFEAPYITVESYVTLNGRRSRPFIDPAVNLAEIKDGLKPKHWILPFEELNRSQ